VRPAPTAPSTTRPGALGTRPVTSTTVRAQPVGTTVAEAVGPSVAIYTTPGAPVPAQVLPNPWTVDPARPASKVPQVFLVAAGAPVAGWVRVLLPVRPNGSTGWVRASGVSLTAVRYRIRVSLREHRIDVVDGAAVVYSGPVAVGAPRTPTPTGHYYVRVLIKAPNPHTVYGPYAYGLSSHSEALSSFDGGDAEIGIHGNDDASVLGHDVTHGCIRIDNDAITRLAPLLPLGTPVDVVA